MRQKKKIRLVLALTLLMPVWFLTAFALFIFPGAVTFFLAPFVMLGLAVKLWLKDSLSDQEKRDIKVEIKDALYMMFCPIVGAFYHAQRFIEEGDLSFS